MRTSHLLLMAAMLALSACGGSSSDRPTYSGREEPTAGVPGFSADGKRKLHPTVKLGQSYTVGGKTYVPRYQPDYKEEGMASWYGPGFHGGKTANGERFSTHDRTAAHTTLPMPSIVRVTYLKTGKSTFVRINDRGPFAHNRIIDLSKAAAEDIGMLADGVGKVRVEYMPAESNRFAELLSQGREPGEIDLASEVIGQSASDTQYADQSPMDESIQVSDVPPTGNPDPQSSVWDRVSPISSANAEPAPLSVPGPEPVAMAPMAAPEPAGTYTAMPPATLPPPGSSAAPVAASAPTPAMTAMNPVTVDPPMAISTAAPPAATPPRPEPPPPNIPPGITAYVQLGAFSNQQNAMAMQKRFADVAEASLSPANVGGLPIYRVRLGPFVNEDAALEMLERAHQMGVADAKLVSEHN